MVPGRSPARPAPGVRGGSPLTLRHWLHAARVVTLRQAAGRAGRPVRRRRFPRGPTAPPRPLSENEALWRSDAFAPTGAIPDRGSRLARFQAHYGEDVLEAARAGAGAESLARAWIAANPPRNDDAWHPYVSSTRAANWLAAATLEPELLAVVRESLGRALGRVAANVEDDVLGNHLIRNAKALILGGIAFGHRDLERRGRALLGRELEAQILSDGGHYERSPAYHRLVLRDLLELRQFVDLEEPIARMTAFAAATARPDGAPALFNDGGLDVAPRLSLPTLPDGLTVLEESGYAVLRRGRLWLAFDCGPPAPRFLPAHAHADGLSFQLWLDGLPVVVDPGMPTYDAGPERDFLRSSAAHSTVSVGAGQFEPWAAFRAGPLPEVRLLEATGGELCGSVRDARGAEHRRRIRFGGAGIDVEDELAGRAGLDAVSTLLVAPGADPSVEASGAVSKEERTVSERFGDRRATFALLQRGAAAFAWAISTE